MAVCQSCAARSASSRTRIDDSSSSVSRASCLRMDSVWCTSASSACFCSPCNCSRLSPASVAARRKRSMRASASTIFVPRKAARVASSSARAFRLTDSARTVSTACCCSALRASHSAVCVVNACASSAICSLRPASSALRVWLKLMRFSLRSTSSAVWFNTFWFWRISASSV